MQESQRQKTLAAKGQGQHTFSTRACTVTKQKHVLYAIKRGVSKEAMQVLSKEIKANDT